MDSTRVVWGRATIALLDSRFYRQGNDGSTAGFGRAGRLTIAAMEFVPGSYCTYTIGSSLPTFGRAHTWFSPANSLQIRVCLGLWGSGSGGYEFTSSLPGASCHGQYGRD